MASDSNMDAEHRRDGDPGIIDAFASGLKEAVAQPFNGASELLGGPKSHQEPLNLEGASKFSHDFGTMLGSAAMFVSVTKFTRRLFPGAGKLAPISAGAGLGFLAPTEDGNLAERFQHAAIGAGTATFLELGPSALTRVGIRGSLVQNTISGGAAGGFHTQADSISRHGELASLSDTMLGAGTWAGTGLTFTAAGRIFSRRGESAVVAGKGQDAPPSPSGSTKSNGLIELPGLELGVPIKHGGMLSVAPGSEIAKMYAGAQGSIGRAEVLAVSATGATEGRLGTVFSVSKDGRMLTANHVVEKALDVTIFDHAQKPHGARVVASNPQLDIAVLQLKDPASFAAFEPLPLATGGAGLRANPANVMTHTAFGHPNGWRELHATRGTPINNFRHSVTTRFLMPGQEGLSGAPMIADGAVQSILIQGARTNGAEVIGTPIHHGIKLLEGLPKEATVSGALSASPKLDLQLIRSFKIGDQSAAAANLDKLFGPNFTTTELPPSFFHARVKTVPLKGAGEASDALTMKMQYNPAEQQLSVQPIAFNGKPIGEVTWPNSTVRIDSAKIVVKFDATGKPEAMVSHNDPGGVLQQGFNYRGENNYLADLKPAKPRDWMDLFPPALRFRRTAKN